MDDNILTGDIETAPSAGACTARCSTSGRMAEPFSGGEMNPSSTDIRRMLAKAQQEKQRLFNAGDDISSVFAGGVEAALSWVLGERKEPIA